MPDRTVDDRRAWLRPAGSRRAAVVLTVAVALALVGGCGHGGGDATWRSGGGAPGASASAGPTIPAPASPSLNASGPAGGNPLSGYAFYVEPSGPAARQVTLWRSQGRSEDAQQLTKISARPLPKWLTSTSADTSSEVNALVRRAAAAHQMPVLVAYAIPHRDCGSFSAGGAASVDAYRAWMRGIAAGIGHQPALVILEPDAIAHSVTGCGDTPTAERYALLADAVVTLKASGSVRVYLDAGNPAWMRDHLKALANALRRSGVARSDGFALNVANFVTTAENASFGRHLSDELGGTHFVIDTSRNGNGPWPDGAQANGGPAWCNPPGRALGHAPTSQTGLPRVDALLWVKRPGESDGPCRPGEPSAGAWWPEYALDLARRAP